MENRKFVKFLIFTLGIFLIFPFLTRAYNYKTTHPFLTEEIVDLFNYYYPDSKISDSDKESIKKGSTDEDTPPRWIQHFYDPVYNRGLVLVKEWQKSKDWSQDTIAQAKYDPVFSASLGTLTRKLFSSKTDYSWDRAIYEYAWGDKEKSLEALGHILHLLEDATVPEHTRNDIHLPFLEQESPYEGWTTQFTENNFNVSEKLINKNQKPFIYSDINQYFDNNAIYSNNNFFSKDTILKYYENPKINFEKSEILSDNKLHIFGYGNKNNKLTEIRKERNIETGNIINIYEIKDKDNLILSDYWDLLSEQTVLNGAGVVKLFFNEVEKEKNSRILLSKNTSFFGKVLAAIGGIFSNSSDDEPSPMFLDQSSQNSDSKNVTITYDRMLLSDEQSSDNLLSDDFQEVSSLLPLSMTSTTPPAATTSQSIVTSENSVTEPINSPSSEPASSSQVFTFPPSYSGSGASGPPPPPAPSPDAAPAPDTTVPDISFSIPECSNSSSPASCVLATTTLNLIWSSLANDLDFYELTLAGSVSTTTATSINVAVSDNLVYNFSVRAKDTTGNWSVSQSKSVEIYIPTFITNPSIDSDTTFTRAKSPYVIDNVLLAVQVPATLTIEPGVVIKFKDDAGISVLGKIIVQGTASQQVVFTSYLDDGYGGDANADAGSTAPASGDWYGVEVLAADSVFDNAIFRYGGKWYAVGNHMANLSVKNVSLSITNSVFEYSKVYGLRLENSNSSVSDNIFRNNGVLDPAGYDGALTIINGSPSIQSNNFSNNRRGIYVLSPLATIESNYFSSNTREAIFSVNIPPTLTNNSGLGNATNGIFLSGDVSQAGATTTLIANPLAYVFDGGLNVPVNSGLVVEPGVNFKAGGGVFGGRLDVYGNLVVQGTNPEDIIFTAAAPGPGNWYGIRIYGNSNIKGATFKYAHQAVSYYNSPIKLENTRFENNNLAVWADPGAAGLTVTALMVEIENLGNLATTSPSGLW